MVTGAEPNPPCQANTHTVLNPHAASGVLHEDEAGPRLSGPKNDILCAAHTHAYVCTCLYFVLCSMLPTHKHVASSGLLLLWHAAYHASCTDSSTNLNVLLPFVHGAVRLPAELLSCLVAELVYCLFAATASEWLAS